MAMSRPYSGSRSALKQRLQAAMARGGIAGPMASPPTYSVNTAHEPRLSNFAAWNSPLLTFDSATWVQQASNAWSRPVCADSLGDGSSYLPATVNVGGGGGCGGIWTKCHDRKIELYVRYSNLTVLVLNHSTGKLEVAQELTGGDPNNFRYVLFDFGSVDERIIRIEGDNSLQFRGIYYGPGGTLAPFNDPLGLRGFCTSDSFGEPTGALISRKGYLQRLGQLLGIYDWRVAAKGGTGLSKVNTGISPNRCNYKDRFVVDCLNNGPYDVILIQMSGNDTGESTATVQTNLEWMLQQVVAKVASTAWPRLPLIIVSGTWTNSGNNPPATMDALGLAAIANVPEAKAVFFSQGTWITGGGKTGSPYYGTLTFTAALSGATSGTLTSNFAGPSSNFYAVVFSDGTVKTNVTLNNGQPGVSWSGAVTADATADYYNTSLTNAGNASTLVGGVDGTDGTHPSPAGHEVRGELAFTACAQIVNAM